jgi:hypothetical protein
MKMAGLEIHEAAATGDYDSLEYEIQGKTKQGNHNFHNESQE